MLRRLVATCLVVALAACASTTTLHSSPEGAKVYLNGEYAGTTPYSMTDTKIVGSTTHVRLEREGYAPLETDIVRNEELDVGALIGGIFFLVPFLWIEEYKPTHTYELQPAAASAER